MAEDIRQEMVPDPCKMPDRCKMHMTEVPSIGGGHRGAIAFARGGIVALAIAAAIPVVAGWTRRAAPSLQPVASLVVALSIPAGFAAGAMLGMRWLDPRRRSVVGFAAGFLVGGLLLSWTLPNLQGLTGREPAAAVVSYAALSFGAAFAVAGGLGGWAARGRRRIALVGAASFGAGGAIGGLLLVTPFLAGQDRAALGSGEVAVLLPLFCLSAAVLVPFVVGGTALGRELEKGA